MYITPEKKLPLILDLIRSLIFNEDGVQFFCELSTDEKESVCFEADRKNLGALLYFYLHEEEVMEGNWDEKFSGVFRAMSAVELKRISELRKLFRIFKDNGIVAAPLKGAALAYTTYPHPALRSMSDLDVLIKEEDADKVWNLLIQNSYSPGGVKTENHLPGLFSPGGQMVELHPRISRSRKYPTEFLWQEIRSGEFLNDEIMLLSPQLNILHTIEHALADNLVWGLKAFIDIAFIINKFHPHAEKLKQMALKLDMYFELVFFMNIFPEFFPQEYCFQTESDIEPALESARFIIMNAELLHERNKHSLMLSRDYSQLRWHKKIAYLLGKMLKDREIIQYKYKKKINFINFWYYNSKEVISDFREFIALRRSYGADDFIQKAGSAQRHINICLKTEK